MRRVDFQNSQYYHLMNRGVERRVLFVDREDHVKFLENIRRHKFTEAKPHLELEAQPRVTLVAYSLLEDHFHLLVRQENEGGVTDFMHKLGTGFSMYFNHKYDRSGRLFEGPFKAKPVPAESLLELSGFVHLNLLWHKPSEAEDAAERVRLLRQHIWSSYLDYAGFRQGTLCEREAVWSQLPPGDPVLHYRNWTESQVLNLDFDPIAKIRLEKKP